MTKDDSEVDYAQMQFLKEIQPEKKQKEKEKPGFFGRLFQLCGCVNKN